MKTLSLFFGLLCILSMDGFGQERRDLETRQLSALQLDQSEQRNRTDQHPQLEGLPDRPTNLRATVLPSPAGANMSFIKLSWTAQHKKGGPSWTNSSSNAAVYELERREWPDGEYQLLASPRSNQSDYTDNDVNYATTYLYRVRAKDAQGKTSDWSSYCYATTYHNLDEKLPWWDDWPKISTPVDWIASGFQTLIDNNCNVAGVTFVGDEGIGPYSFEWRFLEIRAELARDLVNYNREHPDSTIRTLAWLDAQNSARGYIGALNKKADGTFAMDPALNAAALISDDWSWDYTGPGINPDANTLVWVGLASFVSNEEWLGDHVISNPQYNLPVPTYADSNGSPGVIPAVELPGHPYYYDPRNAKLYDAMASKDVNGRVTYHYELNSQTNTSGLINVGTAENPIYTGNFYIDKDTASDWWRLYNVNAAYRVVRAGSDGFWVDNISGYGSVGFRPVEKAFGDYSIHLFRSFLKSNHLSNLVSDASSFDIRDYLKRKLIEWHPGTDATDLWNAEWQDKRFLSDPLWRAFLAFKAKVVGEYARNLYSSIKAIDPNKNIYTGGNDIPWISFGAMEGNELDQVHSESNDWLVTRPFSRTVPPVEHAGPLYSTATQFEKSQIAIIWCYKQFDHEEYNRPKQNLDELLLFEALANNVLLNTVALFDSTAIKELNSNLDKLRNVLGVRYPYGEIALLYSTQTQHSWFTPGGWYGVDRSTSDPNDPGYSDHNLGFVGWGAALEDLHYPYRVIPDFKLTLDFLKGVRVLILPHVRSLDEETLKKVLKPFLDSGGTVLYSGADTASVSTKSHLYNPNSVTMSDFARSYPAGIQKLEGNPGLEYFAGQRGASGNDANAAFNTITNTLSSLVYRGRLSGNLAFLGGVFPSTTWGNTVRATMHVDRTANKYFIDLVNIDINYASDTEIRPTPKGFIKLVLPEFLRNKNLRIRSYDADTATDPDPVFSKPDSSHLQIELNPFRLYKLLVIEGDS